MNVKIHYRITQDRAGIPQDYSGARHFVVSEGEAIEDIAMHQLATVDFVFLAFTACPSETVREES